MILDKLELVRPCGKGYIARCPAHEDGRPSLKIDVADDGRVLLCCYAGCTAQSIVEAINLPLSALFPSEPSRFTGPRLVTGGDQTTYQYEAANGDPLFEVVRDPGKRFLQRRPDGCGGWIWNIDGIEPVLYHLPELNAAPERWVALTEGEKDADRLRSLGFLATTAPRGASAPWLDSFTDTLQGHPVVIFADNDPPGMRCAHDRAAKLHDAGLTVKLILLPDLPDKGDVSDWLDAGNTRADLLAVMKATSEWSQDASNSATDVETKSASRPSHAVVLSLSTIEPRPVEWIWPRWLARGRLHLLGGHPGDGKSTIMMALAAAMSRGAILPDGSCSSVCNILLVLAEDDLEDTVRPRLDLHRADPHRIWALKLIKDESGKDRALSLFDHITEM
jgi:5S rRNA maturation endonuclease (ribonuclease M5)